jgi:hypothetical protein
MWRTLAAALIALTTSLVSSAAHADSARVVLVRPAGHDTIVRETITRIRGELVADGFEVSVVDAAPGAPRDAVLADAGQGGTPAATIGLFLDADARSAKLWIVDRLTNKTVVRGVELNGSARGYAPEVLARRSVELLRASLLEIMVDERPVPPERAAARAQASTWATRPLEPPPPRWAAEAGAQVLGVSGVGSAVMPIARVRLALNQRLGARLSLAGLGTRPRVESAGGSATVNQSLGLLEVVADVIPRGRLTPSISLGAGAYHIGVKGSATTPYVGQSDDRWVFAGDAGAGLVLALSPSFGLALESHVTLVTPYPVIRFLDEGSVSVNNPMLSAALTFLGRL